MGTSRFLFPCSRKGRDVWIGLETEVEKRGERIRRGGNGRSFGIVGGNRWRSSPGIGAILRQARVYILSMQRMQSVVTEGVVCRAANGECSS